MGKGLGLVILSVGGLAYLTKDYWYKAQAAKRLDVSLSDVALDNKNTTLSNTVLNIKVSLYNPTDTPILFERFNGNVYLNEKRVTDIDPKPFEKVIKVLSRQDTIIPLTIKLKNGMIALDLFQKIVYAISHKTKIKLEGKLKIIGAVRAEGLTIPINYDYDLSTL
jgi:LEA14-like dessication related protein